MNETAYYAADVLEYIGDNWGTLLAGWFIVSLCLTPLIGLFCATNTEDEKRSVRGYEGLRTALNDVDQNNKRCGPEVQAAIDKVEELLRKRRQG